MDDVGAFHFDNACQPAHAQGHEQREEGSGKNIPPLACSSPLSLAVHATSARAPVALNAAATSIAARDEGVISSPATSCRTVALVRECRLLLWNGRLVSGAI
jgi:hypothetical protein